MTLPASQVYWSWMMTLWRMNERHDCRVARSAFNDNRLPEASVITPAGHLPGRAHPNRLGRDFLPFPDGNLPGGYAEGEGVDGGLC